jgi:hypothetical protein
LTTSNKATLEKLDSLGSNHAIHLTNVKKTITEENLNLKVLIDEKERLFQEAQKNSNLNDLRKKSDDISKLKKSCHPGFVVSFDNIDIHQQRRNMTSSEQNSDFHWVNHKMVENRVSGNHLESTKPTADIMYVKNIEFLPSVAENNQQRMDYIILTSRILTEYIDALKTLKDVCVMHISHMYSKDLSKTSKKVYYVPYLTFFICYVVLTLYCQLYNWGAAITIACIFRFFEFEF